MLNRRLDTFSLPIILFFLCVASQAIADKFSIANSASPETSYDIAFDGTNFLVAIEGETVGAQLVSPSGELIGSFISTGRIGRSSGPRLDGTGPGFPHVAFDGTNYLLVGNDMVSIPDHVSLHPVDHLDPWPGFKKTPKRRRYRIDLNDKRTTELKQFVFTPYADAGNDGAAFRTVFPLTPPQPEQSTHHQLTS